MGMQQKLDRARQEGYEAGLKDNQDNVFTLGVIRGAKDTWDIIEDMIPKLEGVGPKTKEKILLAIQGYAKKEKNRIQNSKK